MRFSGAKSIFLNTLVEKADVDPGTSEFGFKVTTNEQIYRFAVKTKQQQQKWIREINKAVEKL